MQIYSVEEIMYTFIGSTSSIYRVGFTVKYSRTDAFFADDKSAFDNYISSILKTASNQLKMGKTYVIPVQS